MSISTPELAKASKAKIDHIRLILSTFRTEGTYLSTEFTEAAKKEKIRLEEVLESEKKLLQSIQSVCNHDYKCRRDGSGFLLCVCSNCTHWKYE